MSLPSQIYRETLSCWALAQGSVVPPSVIICDIQNFSEWDGAQRNSWLDWHDFLLFLEAVAWLNLRWVILSAKGCARLKLV